MKRISSKEFLDNIEAFTDASMNEPVIITDDERDDLVLLPIEEYRRLQALQKDAPKTYEP